MPNDPSPYAPPGILERAALDRLLESLTRRGYELLGPTVRDGAIVYATVATSQDFPIGFKDEQGPASYRLVKTESPLLFGYTLSPQSWKRFLHPPRERLWSAQREEKGFTIIPENSAAPRLAFIGVRACELRAIAIQDRVLTGGTYVDEGYRARRAAAFIIAVNCGTAGPTCFCDSMGAGPQAQSGFDLALTEVLEAGPKESRHYFLVEAGSDAGRQVLDELSLPPARESELDSQARTIAHARETMGRHLNTEGIKELLYRNYEHPRWNHVAARCLACTNCSMVCPTCFCTQIEDFTSLDGSRAERMQRWDSCFTTEFSYVHGGAVRSSSNARYRQWLTHKLASWIDQFGSSGCVGCGRCITWCPAVIDLTEEVNAIRGGGHPPARTAGEVSHGDA